MSIQLQFLILILSLISGVITIFLAHRMMRKFPLPYLSSYFYFLVFIIIFSIYSVIGSQSIQKILSNHQTGPETIQSAKAVLIALGIPFLILALYMFIRLSRELFKIELPRLFVAIYFLLFAISFAGYTLMNLEIVSLETINFFMDSRQLTWSFTGLTFVVFGYSLIFILIKVRSIKDLSQRQSYLWFVLWYAIICIISIVSLQLSQVHTVFGLIFIVVLTGFHLIPVLFLNIYLPRYYVENIESDSFYLRLEKVISRFEISKREAEIIPLICKGMSNQEISDSLFISLQTVKDHVHRIFTKTGVKNRVQLANLLGNLP
ncbi:MAG: helix-turn-helix transcriptional regulator [Bacteroidales bacterium]